MESFRCVLLERMPWATIRNIGLFKDACFNGRIMSDLADDYDKLPDQGGSPQQKNLPPRASFSSRIS
jgi:hypothetical protein